MKHVHKHRSKHNGATYAYVYIPAVPLPALLTPRTPLMWSPIDGPIELSECAGLGGASGAGRFSGSVSRGEPGCMPPPPPPLLASAAVGDDDCEASARESALLRPPPLVRRLPERYGPSSRARRAWAIQDKRISPDASQHSRLLWSVVGHTVCASPAIYNSYKS